MSKKIVNKPENVPMEMIEGMVKAHERYYEIVPGVKGIAYKGREKGKVAVVIGGGSGHEPQFAGYLGKGLSTAATLGNVFTSPDPNTIYQTAVFADGGAGVLFIYGNYAGDCMNFDMAEELLQMEGIETAHVIGYDDCVSAPKERRYDRRGIAGLMFQAKIVGAAAEEGLPLAEVKRLGDKAGDNTCSVGVATAPGIIPGNTVPPFTLADDEIEFGVGIHGEPGIKRTKFMPADEMTDVMYDIIKDEMSLKSGEEVCVLVNGLGSTSVGELLIVNRHLRERLAADGVSVYDSDVGEFVTCQEMGGFSISLMRLDDEIKYFYNKPCYSPYYKKEGFDQ